MLQNAAIMQQHMGNFRGLVNSTNPQFANSNVGGILWSPPLQVNVPPPVQQGMHVQLQVSSLGLQPPQPHIPIDLLGREPPLVNYNAQSR